MSYAEGIDGPRDPEIEENNDVAGDGLDDLALEDLEDIEADDEDEIDPDDDLGELSLRPTGAEDEGETGPDKLEGFQIVGDD
jgi:hypothetical protein